MSVETALWRRLRASPEVTELVGQRITPVKRGTTDGWEKLPAITYQRISPTRIHHMDGPATLARPRVQISCWSASWDEARAVAGAVTAALDGWMDLRASPPVLGVQVEGGPDQYDEDTKTHHIPVDVLVWHRE